MYKPNCLLDFSLRNNLLVPAAGDLKRITTSSSHLIYFIARIEGKKIFGRTTNRTTEQKSPKEWRGVRCCLKLPYCNLRCFVATSQPAAVEKAFGDVVAGHWKRPSGPADVETTAHDVDLELRFRTVLFLDLFEYRSAQQTPLRAALAFNTPHVVCLECADLFILKLL